MISEPEKWQRRQLIQEKLRKLALPRALPLDEFYAAGHLNPWQWKAGHLFREERIAMLEARAKGWERDPRTGKMRGFSMASIAIERAMRFEWALSPSYLDLACALIGETMIDIEFQQAQWVTTKLAELYGMRPLRPNGSAYETL